ncbi:MAG: hypothetical protein KKG76_12595 [Euryarchaeota archaeon]|nr:hypothetical protein [Euryarchaeota archaeon]
MADSEILRYLSIKTGLGLKFLSKDEKISIALEDLMARKFIALYRRMEGAENTYMTS